MKAPPTISPCLWFDSQAEEAARFYASLFEGSRIGAVTRYGSEGREIHGRTPGSVMTVAFELAGQSFVALNGGPLFTFTPALSLSVVRESAAEVDRLWGALVQGGSVLMELGPYDWSPRYGWLADRYGLSWQISLGSPAQPGQAITPSFLFVGDQYGQGEEAMLRWISLFPDSGIDTLVRVGAGEEPDREGTVRHARFHLGGRAFTLMESGHPHAFSFSEALSLMVPCATQDEVDHYWAGLGEGGQEGPCGWVKDRFGVSWQVAPSRLDEMLRDPDSEKVARVTRAFLGMGRFDLAALERAYVGSPEEGRP